MTVSQLSDKCYKTDISPLHVDYVARSSVEVNGNHESRNLKF